MRNHKKGGNAENRIETGNVIAGLFELRKLPDGRINPLFNLPESILAEVVIMERLLKKKQRRLNRADSKRNGHSGQSRKLDQTYSDRENAISRLKEQTRENVTRKIWSAVEFAIRHLADEQLQDMDRPETQLEVLEKLEKLIAQCETKYGLAGIKSTIDKDVAHLTVDIMKDFGEEKEVTVQTRVGMPLGLVVPYPSQATLAMQLLERKRKSTLRGMPQLIADPAELARVQQAAREQIEAAQPILAAATRTSSIPPDMYAMAGVPVPEIVTGKEPAVQTTSTGKPIRDTAAGIGNFHTLAATGIGEEIQMGAASENVSDLQHSPTVTAENPEQQENRREYYEVALPIHSSHPSFDPQTPSIIIEKGHPSVTLPRVSEPEKPMASQPEISVNSGRPAIYNTIVYADPFASSAAKPRPVLEQDPFPSASKNPEARG
jgi:hypothetical protein